MSTVFYIKDKRKKKEYEDFCKFLESYEKKIQDELSNYTKEVNGELVNEDNLEYDIEKKTRNFINSLKYCIDEEEIRFGQVSMRGFTFFMDYTCRNLTCFNDVEKMLKENENLIIVDEYDDKYSLDEFKEIVETGVIKERD